METKANYVLLGAATVIGALLIMLFALWLANSGLKRSNTEYDVVFSDPVRGLQEGGEVRFNGIKVGEVETLRIDRNNFNRVIARIKVFSDTPVRKNSVAQLEPVGLTGVTLIQLSPGTPNEQLVPAAGFGAPPPVIQGKGSPIDMLMERSENIAVLASEAMAGVRNLLTPENIQKVSDVINDLHSISHQLAQANSVINRSGETAEAVTRAANSISSLAQQTQSDMSTLHDTMQQLNSAAQEANGQAIPELTRAAEQIGRAANAVSRVANDIGDKPSVLTPQAPRPTVDLPR